LPLAAGIAGDLYVAMTKAIESQLTGLIVSIAMAALLVALWFVWPVMSRRVIKRDYV
jgi:hypothetical protein